MRNLYFSRQFADAIRSGKVCQTVRRNTSGNPIVTGMELRLREGSWGTTTQQIADVVCTGTEAVEIAEATLTVGSRPLDTADREAFATACGFKDYAAMVAYHRVLPAEPFDGWVIRWGPAVSDTKE